MRVIIWHNITTDDQGRPLGMLDGYKHGHILVPVASYEAEGTDAELLASAFQIFNVGDDPDFGEPNPLAQLYRLRGNRSLSVGDVVSFTEEEQTRWHACARFGWDSFVPRPEFFGIGADRPGSKSLDRNDIGTVPGEDWR